MKSLIFKTLTGVTILFSFLTTSCSDYYSYSELVGNNEVVEVKRNCHLAIVGWIRSSNVVRLERWRKDEDSHYVDKDGNRVSRIRDRHDYHIGEPVAKGQKVDVYDSYAVDAEGNVIKFICSIVRPAATTTE